MRILVEIDDNKADDMDYIFNLINESVQKLIPDNFKRILANKENRQEMLKKYGDKAFLLPKELKFPVVDPNTGKYHCGLIYSARLRAKQWQEKKPEYIDVFKKANELYYETKCENKINITIHDHYEEYDLYSFLEMINLDFSNIEYS